MGWLYLIGPDSKDAVKIGYTGRKSPRRRLKELQCGSYQELKLFVAFPGTEADEAALHEQFSALHIRGEWFRWSPQLEKLVVRKRSYMARRQEVLHRREVQRMSRAVQQRVQQRTPLVSAWVDAELKRIQSPATREANMK